jgi:hypothetical protein
LFGLHRQIRPVEGPYAVRSVVVIQKKSWAFPLKRQQALMTKNKDVFFVQSLIGVTLKQREMFYALLTSTSSDDIVMRNLINDMNPDHHAFVGDVPRKHVVSESDIDAFVNKKAAEYNPGQHASDYARRKRVGIQVKLFGLCFLLFSS